VPALTLKINTTAKKSASTPNYSNVTVSVRRLKLVASPSRTRPTGTRHESMLLSNNKSKKKSADKPSHP